MEFVLKYLGYWLILIVLLSLFFTYLLYFQKRNDEINSITKFSLAALRFLVFTLLGILLLSPLLKSYQYIIKKPVILVGVDNSKSMVSGADSLSRNAKLPDFLNRLKEELTSKYDVEFYSFGNDTKEGFDFNFDESATNISSALQDIQKRNRHRNVGGLVLLTDGIYNLGENPLYQVENITYPIYTFGFGDTNRYKDLAISRFLSNKIAFLGDKIPVVVDLKMIKCTNQPTKLKLFFEDKKIDEKLIIPHSDYQFESNQFLILADKPGIKKIHIEVQPVEGEVNIKNNSADFFVEIIDSRQKIGIAYESPHPDIGALNRCLKSSDNYEVKLLKYSDITDISDFNLLILYGLPSKSQEFLAFKNKLIASKVPYLLIANSSININFLNTLATGIKIVAPRQSWDEALPVIAADFELFTVSDEIKKLITDFAPLTIPHGNYSISNNIQKVLVQQIGAVKTEFPLLVMTENDIQPHSVLLGEGIWRWWFTAFNSYGNENSVNEFFLNIIRATSLKIKNQRLHLQYQNIYSDQDRIVFRAIVYNGLYQPVTESDLNFNLLNTNTNKSYSYTFSKNSGSYNLDLGNLESGTYNFTTSVQLGSENLSQKGKFIVQNINREQQNTQAQFALLSQISNSTKGKFWPVLNTDSLMIELSERPDIVNVENRLLRYSEIIDFKWLLGIIAFLISIEWFLRKYLGIF